jgi:hypothetical protein
MIVTPQQYTPVHNEEVAYQATINEETIKKIIYNNNWLLDLMPLGSIVALQTNQPGGGTPDPNIYQFCDGSEITNSNSPIRSIGLNQRFVPDLRAKFPRAANNLLTNPISGTWEHNLAHGHGTGGPSSIGATITANKGDRRRRDVHNHSVPDQYASPTIIETPAYIAYNFYMKIS